MPQMQSQHLDKNASDQWEAEFFFGDALIEKINTVIDSLNDRF